MKNVAHSVRERLLNRARETGLPHEYLLVRYALERILYRLSVSPHAGRFILKGALLFTVWGRDDHRPTRDADLLGSGPGEIELLESAFRDICAVACDDGIIFNPNSVRGERIAEDKVYTGVRVLLEADLAKARIRVQVDVGFGDAVTPGPEPAEYPSLLNFPAPMLRVYPVYTVVAEKLHAMVALALDNSRMKDFYDLWAIAKGFDLESALLAKAIAATFERRQAQTPLGGFRAAQQTPCGERDIRADAGGDCRSRDSGAQSGPQSPALAAAKRVIPAVAQDLRKARKWRSSRSTSSGLSSGRKWPQLRARPRTSFATARQSARQSNSVPTGECFAQSASTGISSFCFLLFLSCTRSIVAAAR